MSGLAIASLVQSGVELHWTPPDQTFQAGLILVAVPFVLQLLACIFSYLARDGATGAAVGVLATSWLAIGLIHIAAKPGATSAALGLLLLAAGGALGAAAAAIASSKPLPGAIFAAAALRFAIAGVYQLSTITFWEHAAGVLGLLVTALALYATLAFELEGQRERPVLPTFRRGRAAAAIRDGAGSDRDRLVTEPGVRETT
jgi:succinate-acetate transporter protein